MAQGDNRNRDRNDRDRRPRFRQIGGADRSRLEGWQGLMTDLGVTPPASVQRFLDNPDTRVRRGQARRGVVAGPPRLSSPAINESAYNAMLASMGGGAPPAGAMSYQNYANADDFARLGNVADPTLQARYTVPTQVGGVPNVIPAGARITYEGYGQSPNPQPTTPPLTQATRNPQPQPQRRRPNRGRR